ncbi:hypothetical protein [Chryseobacterium sp. HR92]|jgi:transcriptional regulator with XRE-family HTH domain|uniref:hypothetical protein n=1 Tax=Chryseobacterium sp. HR92 TaxID=3094839 RepID=UPI00388EB265|nr:hypothetical protein SFA27_16985 [Chryseobacterium sp. HR92]
MNKTENTELHSVKNRLIHFINSKGLSQSKFEKQVGLSNGYVNNIVNTISDKTFDYKISATFPELNKVWVLHGEGEMLLGKQEEKISKTTSAFFKDLPIGDQLNLLHKEIADLRTELKKEKDENAKNTEKIIDFVEEYFKPVFDFMTESMKPKKKDNKT